MKCWLILVFAFGMRPSLLMAQSHVVDSLQAALRADVRLDTTRARRLQALSQALFLGDALQSTKVLEQALALSRQLHDSLGMGQELLGLGTRYRRQAEYTRARQCTQQAQTLFAKRHDMAGLANTFLQWSLIEKEQANLAAALQAAQHGLPYAEKSHKVVIINRTRVAIGGVYLQLGNYQDALAVLLPIFSSPAALRDEHMIASALNMVGNCYQKLNDQPNALRYLRRSVKLNRKTGDVLNALSDEISLSELYAVQGNLPQAMDYATMARAEAKATKDVYNLSPAELAVARVYLLQGRTDSAVALAKHAFALSQQSRSNEGLRDGSNILAQAYARGGDFASAYQYQRMWVAYKDSVAGIETQRRISALRHSYELGRRNERIKLLTQEKQLADQRDARRRLEMLGLLAGVVSLVLLAALLTRNVLLKQRANRNLNEKNAQIAQQRDHLDSTLTELKATQNQLVRSEKMVALAALTAGVAHEIQNPLNFVNNFSEVSKELLAELEEESHEPVRDAALEASLLSDLKQNLNKIHQHGARASDIVKGMLKHARADTGQHQPVDLNAMVQDYLRLAYHGLPSMHQGVAIVRTFDLDSSLGMLELVPQEIGRVLLNLFTNALYAVLQKASALGPAYTPEIRVSTCRRGGQVELRVRDNGTGIPALVIDKIFDPFFTTKPPGEGTGLGLWLSYDIITKGYGGKVVVHSQEGEYCEFVLTLPVEGNSSVWANAQKEVVQE
jgi:two-component system NtrC family sensor kinase